MPNRVIGVDPHADSIVWAAYALPPERLGYCAGCSLSFRYDLPGADSLAIGEIRRRKKGVFAPDYHRNLSDLVHHIFRSEPTLVVVEDIFCRSRAGFKTLAQVQGEIRYESAREVPRSTDSANNSLYELSIIMATTWQSSLLNHFNAKALLKGKNSKAKSEHFAQLIMAELVPELPADEVLTSSDICDALCLMYYGLGLLEEE